MRKTEDNINKWKDIHGHRFKELICIIQRIINAVKMSPLPKAIYRFKAIPPKCPMAMGKR